jgi:DNA-binding transcriptional ArsR family regulator
VHVFALLGDPVRLRIVELLASGEKPVWRLAELLGPDFHISQSAVSHQLRILRDADFVSYRVDGLSRRYRLAWDALEQLDAVVEELFVAWERRDGWPYEDRLMIDLRVSAAGGDPDVVPRRHRFGRAGLRGRTQEEIEPRAGGEEWWFDD